MSEPNTTVTPNVLIWHSYFENDKPMPGVWLLIKYVSKEKDETFGKVVETVGYYSDAFDEYKIHRPIQTSVAETVEPVAWRYI